MFSSDTGLRGKGENPQTLSAVQSYRVAPVALRYSLNDHTRFRVPVTT